MDLGTRGSGTRGRAEDGGLMAFLAMVVGKLGASGLGVGGLVCDGGVGAVVVGCDGATSWSSSRRWLSAVKASYIRCCC